MKVICHLLENRQELVQTHLPNPLNLIEFITLFSGTFDHKSVKKKHKL